MKDDTISRKAAIDAAIEAVDGWDGHTNIGRQKRIEKYINALPSAQPECEDAVSRAEVLDEISNAFGLIDAEQRVFMLPSVTPKQSGWIPVTEKCPEIGQIVLCSLKTRHYYGRIHVCKYRAADKYYDQPYFDWGHNGFPDVVAWQPLPKPLEWDDK